jgi:hypothetical protein
MINDSVLDIASKTHTSSLYNQDYQSKTLKYISRNLLTNFGPSNINLAKNINGTLKFEFSPDTKISTLI